MIQKKHPAPSAEHLIVIGDASYCLGDYYRALESYYPALKILIATLGPKHLDVAQLYYDIGMSYSKLSRKSDARSFLFDALKIREEVLGTNHPDTALTYKSIADSYSRGIYGYWLWNCDDDISFMLSEVWFHFDFDNIFVDTYTMALEYYRKALDYYEFHPEVYDSTLREIKASIATMKADKEKKDNEALACYLKVLNIKGRMCGADSIPYAQILYCIGLVYSNMNDPLKAMDYFQQSLALYRHKYGEEYCCLRNIHEQIAKQRIVLLGGRGRR